MERDQEASEHMNPFLMRPKAIDEKYDPDLDPEVVIRFPFKPFQQKFIF